MVKCDFHIHTSASDGLLSPAQIVKRAVNNNVQYLAITDHDTLGGIDEAISESLKHNIKIIPGIELSTQHNHESIHILGFFKNGIYNNSELIEELEKIKNHRVLRAKEIISKLKKEFNIEISFENVVRDSKDTIARPHIAQAILDAGYNYTFDEVFDHLIGNGCRAYAPTLKLSTIDGINLLKKYNALVFLAHPKLIKNTAINELMNMNFDGIEAIYFQNSEEENSYYINLAKEHDLLISCGSDFHGIENDTRHGDIGCLNLPEEYLSNLLNKIDI